MIHVDCPAPQPNVERRLRERQNRGVDWSLYKPQRVPADISMRNALQEAFHNKCGYCERAGADTIDHFCPRNPLRPGLPPCDVDRTWDWTNFIWACDTCQRRKLNSAPVRADGSQMINPREDEPLRHIRVETETGRIVPARLDGVVDQRGEHTIAVLQLDRRPDLDRDRQEKFESLLELIVEIVDPDSPPASISLCWRRLKRELREHQPFLMIAQQIFTAPSPDLAPLIERLYQVVPEAHEVLASLQRPL